MKFLIVDDSKAMQTIVHKTLVNSGYSDHDYDYAFNGVEALDKIHADPPDIVLSDWHMPEMTGLELLQQLKAEGSKVKIGLVTTEKSDRVALALEAGALFVVSKPFTAATLHDAVEEALIGKIEDAGSALDGGESKSDDIRASVRGISKILRVLSHHNVETKILDGCDINDDSYPFLVSLYGNGDRNKKGTLGVCVVDVALCCYLGASNMNLGLEEAQVSVDGKMIPKNFFDKSKLFLELIASHLSNEDDSIYIESKGVHLVGAKMQKFQDLVEGGAEGSVYLEMDIEGYGKGKLFFIKQ